MKNKYIQLISDIGVFAIGNFLVKLIQYFLLPLYTTAMTTEAYGTAELLNGFSEIMFPITTLAVYEAVFRFSIDEDQDKDSLLYEGFSLVVKGFIIAFILVSIVQLFVKYSYTYYLLFVLFVYSVRMLFANFARGSGFVKCFTLSGIVNALVLVIFSWIFLVKIRLGVAGYLLATGVAHLFSIFILLFGVGILGRLMKRKKNKLILSRMLEFSLPLIPNSIAWWVTNTSSRYIILLTYGASVAGLYTAANKLPAVISMISQVFQQSWQLSSSREYQNKGYVSFLENVFKVYSSGMFIMCSIIICATPILSRVMLKGDFYEARKFVPGMMIIIFLQCISIYFTAILIAYQKTKVAMYGMLIGASINLFFSIVLIRPLGVWGILIAGFFCYLSILIHRILSVDKLIKLKKQFQINLPLLAILCTQAVLMSLNNLLCVFMSLLLFLLLSLIVFCSYRVELKYFVKKILLKLCG